MDELADRLSAALGETYTLGPLLGRGGMATVYQATDHRLRREVAIKVLSPELAFSSEHRARFVREAQTAAGLSHPHIVPIFDVGDGSGLSWFVMAWVDGESLGARVERTGPFPLTMVRRILQEVGQALAYAHARGVVHRDIKPDNVLLDAGSGRAQVTDFGIAAAPSEHSVALTQPGTLLGTARYAAPEQLLGTARVDERADQYALGLVGYFLLAGKHLIRGETLTAIIAEHVKGTAVDVAELRAQAPGPLAETLVRALQASPEGRFPRMEQFLESLREVGGELPEIAPPIRVFFRETERSLVSASFLALGLGTVGVERVPRALVVLMVGAVVFTWIASLEGARLQGIDWPHVRRALPVERARRLEEVSGGSMATIGPLAAAVFALMLGGLALQVDANGQLGSLRPIDMVLFLAAALAAFAPMRILRLHRAQRSAIRAIPFRRWVQYSVVMALTSVTLLTVALARRGILTFKVLLATLLFAPLLIAIQLAVAVVFRRWPGGTSKRPEPEWRVPAWMDPIGALLFARVGRRSGHSAPVPRD